jgi:hypothetical protein
LEDNIKIYLGEVGLTLRVCTVNSWNLYDDSEEIMGSITEGNFFANRINW